MKNKSKLLSYSKGNKCVDCGKIVCNVAIRCLSCARKGKNNPFYGKNHSLNSKEKIKYKNSKVNWDSEKLKNTSSKMSTSAKIKWQDKDYANTMSQAHKGYTFSEEHKHNLSIAHIGKKKGYILSIETRKNISKGKKGKKFTEEARKNMSKSRRERDKLGMTNYDHLRARMSGERNPNWNGGITPLNRLLRNNSMFKIWRELVFLRDNYTCQNPNCVYCGNRIGSFLHAHHIKSFRNYPQLRFNVNNGITYCKGFHLGSKLLHKGITNETELMRAKCFQS